MSIQEVAEKAGVSSATVSRIFNLTEQVAPATRLRVRRIADAPGYMSNASARTLRTQRSRVVGVVLPTLLNPVFAECLDGIAGATTAGHAILPVITNYQLAHENRAVNVRLAGNGDGMVLVVSNPATSRSLARLKTFKLPYVLAYNRHAAHPCESVDSKAAVREPVARLAHLGHS